MMTWRYHLLSLAAIFLALALGVLIGISLSDSGAVNTSQTALADDIQKNVAGLQDQNDALSRDRATNLRYQEDSFPFIVGGRLQGKRIAVIISDVTGDDIQRKLEAAIHGAGGQVLSTTVLNSRFDPAALEERMRNDLKADPAMAAVDDSTLPPVLGRQLAKDIGKGGGNRVVSALQGVLVDSASGRYDMPVDAVILINRADDQQTPAYADLEKQLLLSLNDLMVFSVGCEPSDAPVSEIPLFQSLNISSVDNLDSRIGQVSLVYVLSGEKGAFGIKPTADMLIPILREPRPGTGVAATTPQPSSVAPPAGTGTTPQTETAPPPGS